MKKTSIYIILVISLSCSKSEKVKVKNLNGNKVSAFGHSGMGNINIYPRNSFESLLKSLNLGSDGTELDIQLTKDNVLIAFHDHDLSTSTNIRGLVRSLNWSEIKYGRYSKPLYSNYSIISLDQLFSNIKNLHSYIFTFDCKLYPKNADKTKYYNDYVNALNSTINKYSLGNSFIESQDINFLKLLQLENSNYKLFINRDDFNKGMKIAQDFNLYGISNSTKNITKEQVSIAHDNNIFITIWEVKSKSDNKIGVDKFPDFIQTDKIKNLLNIVK
ncbi:MAG: hypothetical protein JKY30_14630 [Flavobacteriales bacterium]|nr:hypothetical protein [Flavobacteriales bacterium]